METERPSLPDIARGTTAGGVARQAWAPRLPCAALLAALDLTRPELSAVAAAQRRGDAEAAAGALAAHFRSRQQPGLPPNARFGDWVREPGNDEVVQAALAGRYTVIGIEHGFAGPENPEGVPDFTFNPTTAPGTTLPRNHEWLWQFGRFYWWPGQTGGHRRGARRHA